MGSRPAATSKTARMISRSKIQPVNPTAASRSLCSLRRLTEALDARFPDVSTGMIVNQSADERAGNRSAVRSVASHARSRYSHQVR